MTLLVATAMGETPDELYERARAASAWGDWVEVRLDGPSGLPWDLRAYFTLPKPALATVRVAEEGGRSHADDRTRAEILRRALRAGARAIDVEAWHDEADALVREAHEQGARVVLSRHDLAGTPEAEEIVDELRAMRKRGADWCKYATTFAGPEDAARLVRAALAARDEGIPFALMAVNDPFLRLLAPTLGMALVYGATPGAPPATPGQVSIETLRQVHTRAAPAPRASATTRAAYVLGHPVAHSLSPRMQNAAFQAAGVDACYLALDVAPEDLAPILDGFRAAPPLGVNVTIPHKVAIMQHVDELDPSARQAGAANTLVFHGARVVGHNTDGAGALDALAEAGARVRGARTLLLGAGGAARALAHALRDAGAEVTLTNRTAERAEALARETGATTIPWDRVPDVMAHVDLLVNATSLGLHGETTPARPERMPTGAVVLDAVYAPGGTPLVQAARKAGRIAVPGEAMLLHQGARAFHIWTGKAAPVAAMRAALEGAP